MTGQQAKPEAMRKMVTQSTTAAATSKVAPFRLLEEGMDKIDRNDTKMAFTEWAFLLRVNNESKDLADQLRETRRNY